MCVCGASIYLFSFACVTLLPPCERYYMKFKIILFQILRIFTEKFFFLNEAIADANVIYLIL